MTGKMIAGLGAVVFATSASAAPLVHDATAIGAIEGDSATPTGWGVQITGTNSTFTADTPSAGLLTMHVDSPSGDTRFINNAAGLGSEWTMETLFQMGAQSVGDPGAFQVITRSGSNVEIFVENTQIGIGTAAGGTALFSGLSLAGDGQFHTLRVGLDSGGTAHVWLDGVEATYTPGASGDDLAIFGDSSSTIDEGDTVFDYVRYSESYQPVPEPGSLALLGLGALAMIRRRRG